MLELKSVGKCFGSFQAVQNFNYLFKAGEITVLLGPNGAGKTTSIKMMVGLLKPSKGEILFQNELIYKNLEYYKKYLSYIPDFPFLYERLTGREFLDFVGTLYEVDKEVLVEKIEKAVEKFQLWDVLDKEIRNYSHGMRQRLVFCSSMIREVKVFIIDEPMVGLDPKTAKVFKDLLREIRSSNAVVVVSTHQLSVAEEVADNILILNKGKVIKEMSRKDSWEIKGKNDLEDLFLVITENEE